MKSIANVGWLLLLAMLAGGAATQPATRPGIAQDTADLGSADFAVRQSATRRLWRAGMSAEPILKAASKSDNPETAQRSKILLQYIDDGIVPSTPPAVIRMLDAYRLSPQPGERNALVEQLRTSGIDGVRVLLRLREHVAGRDRKAIQLALQQSPRIAVALLLYEGDRAGAEALLDPHLAEDDTLAYWMVRGEVHEKIEPYRRQADGKLLCRLEWADGQIGPAMRDARESGNVDLARGWMVLRGDWPGLASQIRNETIPQAPLVLGTDAAICRFAGDSASADKLVGRIGASDNRHGNSPDDDGVGEALCMNDRPDEVAREWADQGLGSEAAEAYQMLLQYKQMLALVDRDPTDVDAVRLQAESAGILYFLGEHSAANEALASAMHADARLHDVSVAGALCLSAAQMHRTQYVDASLLDALVRDEGADSWLLDMANLPNPTAAAWWWRCLREREAAPKALQTVEALAGHHASKEDALKLARTLDEWSQSQPVEEQPDIVKAIVAAMKVGDSPDDAMLSVYRDHAETFASAPMLVELGDALADRKQWAAAASAYGRAVELDPSGPVPIFLQGWAMVQAGDTDAGKAQIELAHLLPLGDMQLRLELFAVAHDHGLTADADRERKLIFALGEFGTFPMTDVLRISAEDAEKQKDYPAAERCAQQEMIAAASGTSGVSNPLAYAELAGNIHRLAAMASLAAHHPAAAMPEAALYYKDQPADVNGLIALVRLADATGASKQADELFKMGHDDYTSLSQAYPGSGGLHNQVAWADSRCHRDLDEALAQAKRAVELDPDNTASMDTLAESYYQRHEFQNAIDTIQKCIVLEPDEPHHRKQLARFELALKTGVADND